MDWNRYREQFPTRYWQEGEFDALLAQRLQDIQHPIASALDVGGGVTGTQALQDLVLDYFRVGCLIPVDLLDPGVATKPSWMRAQITWESPGQYDLVVSRGAINYLTVEQLHQLRAMLSPRATLIVNTFLTPPSSDWSERPATNGRGEHGVERSRLVGHVVEHRLVFPDYTVDHAFIYHPLEVYQAAFGQVRVEQYGKNSYLIIRDPDHA